MKKLLFLLFVLFVCTAVSAFADSPICVDTAGDHTLVLDGVTISDGSLRAIEVRSPATGLTIVLKNNTINKLSGGFGCAGIANNGITLVIRCERAGEGHECDEACGSLSVLGGNYGAGVTVLLRKKNEV